MKAGDFERLNETIRELEERARGYGLDFFDMRYEVCPPDVVYTIAGFGMPTRYAHWSFGKQYYRQKLDFDLGLSRIYELVVNNDPCYAFLLDANSVLQNEVIVAHVLGHSDFFKNNSRFRHTNRQMVETMAVTANRFRGYEQRYTAQRVEEVLDAALSIQEHLDPYPFAGQSRDADHAGISNANNAASGANGSSASNGFDALSETTGSNDVKAYREKDLLRFIAEHSPYLEEWERDVVSTVRQEMHYFWPQLETKIMNEGWASYWHNRLMRDLELNEGDALDFAKMTAGVTQRNPFSLNPYHLGLALWTSIEQRYGREAMFEIRECDSDVSFLRNYLNQDVVDECQLYLYQRRGSEYVITETNVEPIRDMLVNLRTNCGFPTLFVEDAERSNRAGGLQLVHAFEGQELDPKYIERTLPRVYRLWGSTVTLTTVLDGREVRFIYDGEKTARRVV